MTPFASANDRWLVRICAPLGIVGATMAVVATALHPDMPADAQAALSIVARYWNWPLVHFGIIAAALLSLFGLRAVITLFPDALAYALAQLAILSALIGAGVLATAIGIDGYTTVAVAKAWVATGAGAGPELSVGHAVELIHNGLAYIWMPLFLGLPPLLCGVAFAVGRRALVVGCFGVVAGGFVLVSGVSNFLATNMAFEFTSQIGAAASVLWYFCANVAALASLRPVKPSRV